MRRLNPRGVLRSASGLFVGSLGCLLAGGAGGAQEKKADPGACTAWVVEYQLVAGSKLSISDTPMGAGDGDHAIRSGVAKIRFRDAGGKPAPGAAELLELRLAADVNVEAGMLGVSAKVKTKSKASFTPDTGGVVAKGKFEAGALTWSSSARGYRSSADIHCEGALCGRFGAPPEGDSKSKHGPYPVQLQPFRFAPDGKSFSMAKTRVNHTQSPEQTTSWTLRAKETKRSCVAK